LDKSRLRARIGRLDPEELAALEDAVLVTLGIQKW
jgi:mRNA-degrading endonuclease toxin of MazEF toxin-antitoxin module